MDISEESRDSDKLVRGKVARTIGQGVSNEYHRQLAATPPQELMAGNITRSLTKNILKVISSEVKKVNACTMMSSRNGF